MSASVGADVQLHKRCIEHEHFGSCLESLRHLSDQHRDDHDVMLELINCFSERLGKEETTFINAPHLRGFTRPRNHTFKSQVLDPARAYIYTMHPFLWASKRLRNNNEFIIHIIKGDRSIELLDIWPSLFPNWVLKTTWFRTKTSYKGCYSPEAFFAHIAAKPYRLKKALMVEQRLILDFIDRKWCLDRIIDKAALLEVCLKYAFEVHQINNIVALMRRHNIPRHKAMALRLAPHCHDVGFFLGCMTMHAADDRSEPPPNWKEDRDFVFKLHERMFSPLSDDYQMDLYKLYVDDFQVTRVLLEHYPRGLSVTLHPRRNDPYFKTIKQQAHERRKLRELPKLCSFLLARHRDFKRAELMKRVDLWLGSRGEVAFVA